MLPAVLPDTVRDISLFSGLADRDKDALLQAGRIRQCPKNVMLFAHGDPVTHFYLILKGTFQLFRANAEGNQKTIDVLKCGQTMCEGEILDACRTHRVNAVPVEDSVVLEFPVAWLKDNARRHSAFALNLLSLISSQAHMAELEAEHQATMSAAQLVACFLQRLCVLYGFDPQGFDLPYSKTLIASRLGMELETFSRTLVRLRERGIAVDGSHVKMIDIDGIREYVCGACSIADDCPTQQAMEKNKPSRCSPPTSA